MWLNWVELIFNFISISCFLNLWLRPVMGHSNTLNSRCLLVRWQGICRCNLNLISWQRKRILKKKKFNRISKTKLILNYLGMHFKVCLKNMIINPMKEYRTKNKFKQTKALKKGHIKNWFLIQGNQLKFWTILNRVLLKKHWKYSEIICLKRRRILQDK